MVKLLGVVLFGATVYFWSLPPRELGLFGGWLSSKFHWGRVVAILLGAMSMVCIFIG